MAAFVREWHSADAMQTLQNVFQDLMKVKALEN